MAIKNVIFLVVLISIVATACKKWMPSPDDCSTYDYNNCNTVEPVVTDADLRFTVNDKVRYVPFVILRGNIENGDTLFVDTAYNSLVEYYLEFGTYSVIAEYHIDGKTVYAVDGGKAEKWSQEICDSTCWGWDKLEFDLMLH